MGDGSVGEEKSALDDWKKEAEENIKALEEIQKIAALSNTLNGYEDYNADNAWNAFESKIEGEKVDDTLNVVSNNEVSKSKTSVFSIKNLSKIAAILVVVAGSIFVLNQYSNQTDIKVENEAYSADLEMLEFDLKDGTKVTLDKKSDLKVLNDRAVSLVGRAHFDVQRDESQQFSIDLPLGKIVVLGTEFTVDVDDKTTEIYVNEGSVRYESANRTWILVAGDLMKVSNNDTTVVKGSIENYDSWKNQILIFRDNNMEEVVDALSRHFKKEIIIENKKGFSKCNVMNIFTNDTLDEILNGLSQTHGLEYQLKDNKVFIVSAKC